MPCVAQTSGSANPALAPHTGSTHHQSRDYTAPSSTHAAPIAKQSAAEPHPIRTQPANMLSHLCTQAAPPLHQLCSLSEPDCTLSVHRRHHHPLPQPLRGFAQAIALDPRGQAQKCLNLPPMWSVLLSSTSRVRFACILTRSVLARSALRCGLRCSP